jgi:LuxR family transcriptional regulator, maltose regulon positive regulatory protein
MVSTGYSNQEIANRLFLALPSVKTHLYNIFQILGVKNRMNAVVKARDLKLLQ